VASARQYLTFRCAGQHCAVAAERVFGIAPAVENAAFAQFQRRPVYIIDAIGKLRLTPKPGVVNRHMIVFETGNELAGFACERVGNVLAYRDSDLRQGWLHGRGRRRKLIDPDDLVEPTEIANALAAQFAQLY
jgi:hypothetical protein